MEYKVLKHPLIDHKLAVLRNEETPSQIFRTLITELTILAAYEATREIATVEVEVKTPVTKTKGRMIKYNPRPLIVPILRAGLGMLEGMQRIIPSAEVGFLGLKRDEETLQPVTYANRLPEDVTNRQCFVIDPMLATGGTLIDSVNYLYQRGGRDITCICILSAPEGVEAVQNHFSQGYPELTLRIFVTAQDEKLNEKGYIVPGLGDAGDRLYGVD